MKNVYLIPNPMFAVQNHGKPYQMMGNLLVDDVVQHISLESQLLYIPRFQDMINA
jgi:iron-sulfur cluster repair protein YtfE (RIC family)